MLRLDACDISDAVFDDIVLEESGELHLFHCSISQGITVPRAMYEALATIGSSAWKVDFSPSVTDLTGLMGADEIERIMMPLRGLIVLLLRDGVAASTIKKWFRFKDNSEFHNIVDKLESSATPR